MAVTYITNIVTQSAAIQQRLAGHPVVGKYIDQALPIPRPFIGSGDIRLVIIGQDPTVQVIKSRAAITTVLNLDRNGNLRSYLAQLCADLSVDLDRHVYATNACKGFFSDPPTTIKQRDGIDVLAAGADLWLPLLIEELAQFPNAVVVSLGEPVLTMLVKPKYLRKLRDYWGYDQRWRDGVFLPMHAIEAEESTIGRRIFPLVHQPTQRGKRAAFYRERRDVYLAFVRETAGLA